MKHAFHIAAVLAAPLALLAAPAMAHADHDAPQTTPSTVPDAAGERASLPDLPPGSNAVLTAAIAAADGLDVIISDVVIPAGAQVPRHYHPGEEFLYVIEGSATHVEEGKPDLPMVAGDAYVIPPRAIHSPIGGPQGARAVVFRVHVAGQPERVLVPLPETGDEPAP